MKAYCDGPGIHVCPLDTNLGYGPFEITPINNQNRILRSSPPYCMAAPNFSFMIKDCDKGSAAWTNWLGWEVDAQDDRFVYRSRRRYCLLKNDDCLFEEKKEQKCCQDPDNDDCENYPPCFYIPLGH